MHRANPAIHRFAAAHHSLVTRDIALEAGLSRSGWRRWHDDGRLVAVHETVARLPGAPVTPEQSVAAAVLACGTGAAASMSTAGWLWDLEGFEPEPIHVTVPVRSRHRLPRDIVVHRPTDVADLRPVSRHGVPTTNPLRLLCDLGVTCDADLVADTLERLLIAKVVSVAAVQGAIGRHARPGRTGIATLRWAMEQRLLGDRPPDSTLEVTFARLLADHGLPPAQFHAVVCGLEVDFVFTTERLVVEVDGRSPHARLVAFETDRERDLRLVAGGFAVVRITWSKLRREPVAVVEHLARALAQRRAS